MATIVIVHGWWSGGWYFQTTARKLRASGHEVYTPTVTGVGERVHLASPEITLETHVQDIVNVLEFEDLRDVVLVGYSYGGMIVTVVADRVPERIRRIVYLDAFVPRDGEALQDIIPELAARMEALAKEKGDGWRIPREPPQPRKTPQPLGPFRDPVRLRNPAANAIPRSYVLFSGNSFPHAPVMARMAERAREGGWEVMDRPWDHTAPETEPIALAELLHELAD
ncbi:MAG TPA: alpha/beta hydrolase family protein [Longimicrobiaceae bacterium]